MTKPRDPQELYETAIHEAGHAVAHIHTKTVFTRVTIRRRGEFAGRVIWAPYAARRAIWSGLPRHVLGKRVMREAIIAAAGLAAEMKYAPKKRRALICNESLITCEGDLFSFQRAIEVLVKYRFVDDSEEAKKHAMEEISKVTVDIIDDYWTGVIALADALMETPTIGYRRARKIILEATA